MMDLPTIKRGRYVWMIVQDLGIRFKHFIKEKMRFVIVVGIVESVDENHLASDLG
jgi:hypothetical protein